MLAMVDSHHSIFASDFWPTLLDVPGFLQQFITPIVKVSKGKKAVTFFNLPEYEQWLESTGTNGKGWNIKYYKGLGTSTSAEAKEYFSNLDLHEINFAQLSIDNVEAEDDLDAVLPDRVQSGSDLIDMVFRKTRVEDRKKWLDTKVSPETFLDYTLVKKEGVKFSEFLNKEYILFSHYDNVRSLWTASNRRSARYSTDASSVSSRVKSRSLSLPATSLSIRCTIMESNPYRERLSSWQATTVVATTSIS
jgi:hypothetical protein